MISMLLIVGFFVGSLVGLLMLGHRLEHREAEALRPIREALERVTLAIGLEITPAISALAARVADAARARDALSEALVPPKEPRAR